VCLGVIPHKCLPILEDELAHSTAPVGRLVPSGVYYSEEGVSDDFIDSNSNLVSKCVAVFDAGWTGPKKKCIRKKHVAIANLPCNVPRSSAGLLINLHHD
jgi:hypothetical protein